MTPVQRAKPPQPRGLVGLIVCECGPAYPTYRPASTPLPTYLLIIQPTNLPIQCKLVRPEWPKIPPTWHQNGSKMEPKWSQLGTKMEQNGAKMGQNFEKNRFKKATQQKRGWRFTGSPLLSRKSGQHGSKLASKIDQKSIKNRCKNRSFFLMPLGVDF